MRAARTAIPGANVISSDADLVRRARARDGGAFRTIMKMCNQRLYRTARSIVRDDREAEDVVQEAYVLAFTHLDGFRSDSTLATWLTRIVINEALGRLRKRRRRPEVGYSGDRLLEAEIIQFPHANDDPERTMAQRQILQLVERATDSLPLAYRAVFVARVIEGLSIEETAQLLRVREGTVKTRLHRARHLVRERLEAEMGPVLLDAFPFAGRRCERLTSAVMRRLGFPD
ncbi:RNA polymerase sigma factor [Arvimicrobium flavum]|uniref:RNA polymerase sigma factor n=1 Tax=Arvimicrobium flavum TaxID=3393320 RepID=UPI00237BCF44|nr:RNA polymerase sigma factor [Mesorhizobium shangrilense]